MITSHNVQARRWGRDVAVDAVLSRLRLAEQLPGFAGGGAWRSGTGPSIAARSAIDGAKLATIAGASARDADDAVAAAAAAFALWREVPAPRRGELVRRI